MCDDINALMNAFSSISLNKMTPIQPIQAAISRTPTHARNVNRISISISFRSPTCVALML